MDWIRRNWPDLLIGLALILVISGIIITLLNGGTFNPFGQRGAGTASLPSRPIVSEEATQENTLNGESADVSVLPLPNVAEQTDTAALDGALGDTVDTVDTAFGEASEISETGTRAGNAVEGVLPDPAETTLGDTDPLLTDIEVTDIDAVAIDTDAALTDDTTLDGDIAQQNGSVEAVLPDDSSGLGDAGAIGDSTSANQAEADAASTALADIGLEADADTGLESLPDIATSADVAASSSTNAPYRISAGSFGVAANAERLAAELRAASYPVFTAQQGDLTIVLVGPYDDSAQAERVARQIESEGLAPGTEVYEFDPSVEDDAATSENQASDALVAETQIQNEAVTSEPVTSVASETQASEAQGEVVVAPAETVSEAGTAVNNAVDSSVSETGEALAVGGGPTNVNVPPTSEAGSYLQVGAYGSIESSNPQRSALEDLGFTVLYVEEQGLVKLLVGPYDAQNVNTAKSQLDSQGIVSFIR